MTWIKICGTTNIEDALMAVEAGADALGFVFYEKSPRNVTAEVVREIVAKLPEKVEKVGVLPDGSSSQFRHIAEQCGLTGVQIQVPLSVSTGSTRATGLGSTLKKIYLSFSAADLMGDNPRINVDFSTFARTPNGQNQNPFGTVILDSGTLQNPGGTGKVFDWEAAVPLVETMRQTVKVVVAGGLNPGNVGEAIRILKPWGVDVVSGVEASPGKKDPEKIRAFINAVRQSEKIV
jgi:phosphoribosylanthranilate isomerase